MANNKNNLFLIFLALFIFLAYTLVKPFISAVVGAMVLSYVLYPVYKWINNKIKRPNVSASIMIIVIILAISVPLVLVSNLVIKESATIFQLIEGGNLTKDVFSVNATCEEGIFCTGASFVNEKISDPYVLDNIAKASTKVIAVVFQKGGAFLLSLPERMIYLFLLLFTSFYLFKQGPEVVQFVKKLLPLEKKHKDKVMNRLKEITYATIYGAIIVAIVQGFFAGIGYYLVGINSFAVLTLVTMIAAIIPLLGAALIWFPVVIHLVVNGILLSDSSLIFKGVGLLIYGIIIVSTIDNFIRPKIIGDRAKANPVLILLGVFGGLQLFGFFGIFVGPVILVILVTLLDIHLEGKK